MASTSSGTRPGGGSGDGGGDGGGGGDDNGDESFSRRPTIEQIERRIEREGVTSALSDAAGNRDFLGGASYVFPACTHGRFQMSRALPTLSAPRHTGVEPIAMGAAWFLMHQKTEATVFGVYGRWGLGKSTFMKLVEKEMYLLAASVEVEFQERYDEMQQAAPWRRRLRRLMGHKEYSSTLFNRLANQMASTNPTGSRAGAHSLSSRRNRLLYQPEATFPPAPPMRPHDSVKQAAYEQCRSIASPRINIVWFNAW
jgi:hypothetical protein